LLRAEAVSVSAAVRRLMSSVVSDLRIRWLHAICACADRYSRSCISQVLVVHWNILFVPLERVND